MYNFSPEQEKEIQSRSREVMYQDFKYAELCNELNILKANGTTNKIKQLRDLSNLLMLKEIQDGKQTKYRIIDVYDKPLLPWYDKDEWYNSFKSIICKMIKDNNGQPLWFTRTPLLKSVGVVNNNYSFIMNPENRNKLANHYDREFDSDYEVCLAVGNILSDRVYDTLRKMAANRIIKFVEGYALKVWENGHKKFITVSGLDENKSQELYKLFFQIDNQAIDNVIAYYRNGRDVNRSTIKQLYTHQVIRQRNFIAKSKEVKDKLKELGFDFDNVEELYDVKFILSDDRLVEQELRAVAKSKELLNLASRNKVLSSKSKELKKYHSVLPGIVETYISSDVGIDYNDEIKDGN